MVNLGAQLQPERFTISAWVRPEVADRPQVIVSKVRNLPGHYQKNFELRVNPGGRLFLYVPSGASWDVVEGQRPLPAGRWTNVTATYDGARAQLFVDGVPDGAPLAVRYDQTTTETFVGARPEGGGRDGRQPAGPTFLFAGGIDDLRIWDRALSGQELQIAAGRIPPPPEPRPSPPPPAYAQPGTAAGVSAAGAAGRRGARRPLRPRRRRARGGRRRRRRARRAAPGRGSRPPPARRARFRRQGPGDLGTRVEPDASASPCGSARPAPGRSR